MPDKARKLFQQLQSQTDPSKNKKVYRDAYAARHLQPRLPFLPLHLKDLCFVKEVLQSSELMLSQAMKVAQILMQVLVWQPYRIASDFGVQGYLKVSVPKKAASTVASAVASPTVSNVGLLIKSNTVPKNVAVAADEPVAAKLPSSPGNIVKPSGECVDFGGRSA